jgi:hypothetical protein
MKPSDKESRKTNALDPEDPDEFYFEAHPEIPSRIRPALPGEWPEGNELLTPPPYTLVIAIGPRRLLKLGAWRSNADPQNTVLQLNHGRIPISSYLERATRKA